MSGHDVTGDPAGRRRSDAEARRPASLSWSKRRRLAAALRSHRQTRHIEDRLAETQARALGGDRTNDRLVATLREAREQIVAKEEIDRLAQPPAAYGVYLERHDDDTIDIFTGGRKLRVAVSPNVELEDLRPGQEVMLNEAMNVVTALAFKSIGEIVTLKEVLADGDRALVVGHTDEERVVRLAEPLRDAVLRAGDALLLENRVRIHLRAHPQDRGRGKARARRGARHQLRRHRRLARADRADSRRGRGPPIFTRTCSASTSCAPRRSLTASCRAAARP